MLSLKNYSSALEVKINSWEVQFDNLTGNSLPAAGRCLTLGSASGRETGGVDTCLSELRSADSDGARQASPNIVLLATCAYAFLERLFCRVI